MAATAAAAAAPAAAIGDVGGAGAVDAEEAPPAFSSKPAYEASRLLGENVLPRWPRPPPPGLEDAFKAAAAWPPGAGQGKLKPRADFGLSFVGVAGAEVDLAPSLDLRGERV